MRRKKKWAMARTLRGLRLTTGGKGMQCIMRTSKARLCFELDQGVVFTIKTADMAT